MKVAKLINSADVSDARFERNIQTSKVMLGLAISVSASGVLLTQHSHKILAADLPDSATEKTGEIISTAEAEPQGNFLASPEDAVAATSHPNPEAAATPVIPALITPTPSKAATPEKFSETLSEAFSSTTLHLVQPGETLNEIAQIYGVSTTELAEINHLSNPNLLQTYQKLTIPQKPSVLAAEPTRALMPDRYLAVESNTPANAVNDNSASITPDSSTIASSPSPTRHEGSILRRLTRSESPMTHREHRSHANHTSLETTVTKLRKRYENQSTSPNSPPRIPQIVRIPHSTQDEIAPAIPLQPNHPLTTSPVIAPVTTAAPESSHRSLESLRAELEQLRLESRQETPSQSNPRIAASVTSPPPQIATATLPFQTPERMLSLIQPSDLNPTVPPLNAATAYLPQQHQSSPQSPASVSGFSWPAQGVLTSGYGPRWGRMHAGIDIAAPVGTPIRAAAAGVVRYADWDDGGYGYLVEIDHPDGSMTRYAHNSRILVQAGQKVERGQLISEMGSTGRSTGPHLHFEIHPPGQGAQDPIAYLPDQTQVYSQN